MPLDPTPWFVGGGAEHSPEVARTLAYAATSGTQGIVQAGDLKVSPTGVPSASVQVAVGAALIPSNAVGGKAQTYVARMATGDTVSIAQTTSSGGRSDLIVVQVEDPFMSGEPWQDPTDPTVGPYVFVRVIPNVPSTTTRLQDVAGYESRSAVTLARIDIPASTGTITAGMIKDLRSLAQPRETTVEYTDFGTNTATLSATAGTLFPPYSPSVPVPTWATHARITLMVAQLSAAGSSTGYGNVQGRSTAGATVVDGDQVAFNFDSIQSNTRGAYIASTYGSVTSLQGGTLKPSSLMRKSTSAQANLSYDQYAQMSWRITFYEKAV